MAKEYNPKIPDRYTRRNHDGHVGDRTYRLPMDMRGDLHFLQQGGQVFLYGDVVDHLGRLEDEREQAALNKKKN